MRLHRLISTSLALALLVFSVQASMAQKGPKGGQPADAAALQLPQECIDAGLTTRQECNALLKKSRGKPQEPAPAATILAPAQIAPAPVTPPATPIAPASNSQPDSAAIGNGGDQKPKRINLPADCIAAGLTSKQECNAFHAQNAKSTPLVLPKPALVAPVQNPSNGAGPKALTNRGAATDGGNGASPAANGKQKPLRVHLAQDCVAAGLATQAECDALHAKGKPAVLQPILKAPVDNLAPAIAPTNGNGLAKDCVDAGLKTQAECDALHAINGQKGKGKHTVAAPLAIVPKGQPATGPVQPIEVVPTLPTGVTKDQVAPLLDSAKLAKLGKGRAKNLLGPASNIPPPANDKAAQAALKPTQIVPIDQLLGQKLDPKAKAAHVLLPQNVTVINQTVINNTFNNNRPEGRPPVNPIGLGIGLVLQLGNQIIINSPGRDQYRMAYGDRDRTDYEQLPRGRYRETISRPDGVLIVTIYDRNGDILRRSRFDADGREIVLAYFDDSYDQDLAQWRDPGDDLPPLQLNIAINDYFLDADYADEGQVQQFFSRPPVEQVQRLYSIDEVKRSARLRDMVRRLEIGDLTFDTGAATISQDQVGALSNVAAAMLALLQQNPAETFLIEGHTDAVGSEVSNLQLSDDRAATVAGILTDFYHIPPENLATQGYGAQFLKVQTTAPERLNRRVVIRRITPLITVANGGQ